MARLQVVQCQCDRCKRVWLVTPGPEKTRPDFAATLGDRTLTFKDLCPSCLSAIEGAWKHLEEWDRPAKQQFGPTRTEDQAVPLTSAPDYTPPKAHSVAASKK